MLGSFLSRGAGRSEERRPKQGVSLTITDAIVKKYATAAYSHDKCSVETTTIKQYT